MTMQRTTLSVDQPLSVEQVDLLCAIAERAGQPITHVRLIQVDEGFARVEWWHPASATWHITTLTPRHLNDHATHIDRSAWHDTAQRCDQGFF